MCGIAGAWWFKRVERPQVLSVVERMAQQLRARGPDDRGSWVDQRNPSIAMAHQRLAILDRSELGRQPMTSASGRYVIFI